LSVAHDFGNDTVYVDPPVTWTLRVSIVTDRSSPTIKLLKNIY